MKRHGPDSFDSWLVTAGLTIISTILYSVVRLSGVLFVASMDHYGVDRKKAFLSFILTDFIQAIFSPLTGFLTSRFGVRLVMALGCLISGVGIASCFFANTIEAITLLWGVIFGIGFGLSIPLLALVISKHFVERRAIALGTLYIGSNVGQSILPGITINLIEYYGLPGTFLILGGMVLNCLPVALYILRPTEGAEDVSKCGGIIKKATNCQTDSSDLPSSLPQSTNEEVGKIYSSYTNNKQSITKTKNIKNILTDDTIQGSEGKINARVVEQFVPTSNSQNYSRVGCQNILIYSNEQIAPISSDLEKTASVTHKRLDKKAFKVFLEPIYIVILFIEAMYEGSYIVIITILVDYSLDVGLELSDTKLVFLVFSMFSIVGLVGFGWETDNGHLSLSTFCGLMFLFRGATSAFIAFSNSKPVLLTAVALHGLCDAPVSYFFPLIIAEYYVPEVHDVALSCRLFLCAPVYLLSPNLIDYFRDELGSYFYLFVLISACCFTSAALSFLIPQLSRCRCGREESILRKKE